MGLCRSRQSSRVDEGIRRRARAGYSISSRLSLMGQLSLSCLWCLLLTFSERGYRDEDLNWDGIVDDADLLAVLFQFGSGCQYQSPHQTLQKTAVDDPRSLCEQGEPNTHPAWFPSRSGGNLKEGGIMNSGRAVGIKVACALVGTGYGNYTTFSGSVSRYNPAATMERRAAFPTGLEVATAACRTASTCAFACAAASWSSASSSCAFRTVGSPAR